MMISYSHKSFLMSYIFNTLYYWKLEDFESSKGCMLEYFGNHHIHNVEFVSGIVCQRYMLNFFVIYILANINNTWAIKYEVSLPYIASSMF